MLSQSSQFPPSNCYANRWKESTCDVIYYHKRRAQMFIRRNMFFFFYYFAFWYVHFPYSCLSGTCVLLSASFLWRDIFFFSVLVQNIDILVLRAVASFICVCTVGSPVVFSVSVNWTPRWNDRLEILPRAQKVQGSDLGPVIGFSGCVLVFAAVPEDGRHDSASDQCVSSTAHILNFYIIQGDSRL